MPRLSRATVRRLRPRRRQHAGSGSPDPPCAGALRARGTWRSRLPEARRSPCARGSNARAVLRSSASSLDLLLLEVVLWRWFPDLPGFRDVGAPPCGHDIPSRAVTGPVGSCNRPEPAIRRCEFPIRTSRRLRRIAQPNQWVPTAANASARGKRGVGNNREGTSAIPAAPFGSPAHRASWRPQ